MSQLILLADDHPLFREALSYIVRPVVSECSIVEASNYNEALTLVKKQRFKLIFVDLNMPNANGLASLAMLKKLVHETPVVVVSGHEEPEIIRKCIASNASGYIVKSASPLEIKQAIKTVLAGNTYVPPNINIDYTDKEDSVAAKIDSLTPSQLRVLIEMGKGKLNKQIGYDLKISEATVKAHITTIFKKLHINNRTQAVLFTAKHQQYLPTKVF